MLIIYRGQRTRATRNRESYERRLLSDVLIFENNLPPTLSPALVKYARRPFSIIYNFLDDTPYLGLWTRPFQLEIPAIVEGCREEVEKQFATGQYHQIIEHGYERYGAWKQKGGEDLTAGAKEELAERIAAWDRMAGERVGERGSWDEFVREVALSWGAKIVVLLAKEIELREDQGGIGYKDRELPWQYMIRLSTRKVVIRRNNK
ncbi:hypothetical protein A0H81_02191 [Grifola frondosa]|uniref:Uncharacterized protein n=1 Tax=Grifola frondosa TaxID=5627 RepID=A0A1C7MLK7_GRIFR|nr:hypothetical protein A0H81_02191 [Grifola frondosa]